MPWEESSVMEERLRFVARLLDGEGMSEVCWEFGISRKTGYERLNRYRDEGIDALTDRSRRPVTASLPISQASETSAGLAPVSPATSSSAFRMRWPLSSK